MTLNLKLNFLALLLGFEFAAATFNFGNTVITIIEDDKGV